MAVRPASTARRRVAAVLAGLALAAGATPYLLAPWSRGALVALIVATELTPLTVVFGLAAAGLAWWATGGRPRQRAVLVASALGGAALALGPGLTARAAARDAGRQLDALRPGDAPMVWRRILREPPVPSPVTTRAVVVPASDGTPLTARLTLPAGDAAPAARPVVVVLYGGAWRAGAATANEGVNRRLAGLGYVVLALDYRHAPRARWPAQRDDVRLGLALLRDSAAAWGADPRRVALWGRSSGGHLATRVAWDTAAPPVTVRGVVAFYAPFDLVAGYTDLPSPDPLDVRAILRDFTGGTPADRPAVYRDASPSTFVRPGLPPTLLVYGRRDHIVLARFGRDAAAALRRARVPVVHLELPAAEHGFDEVPGGPDGQAALWVAERFLARVLR